MADVKSAHQKTVRFTQVVARCGNPHPHTQWMPFSKDLELKRAVKEHRVMLVERRAAGKVDSGQVVSDSLHAGTGQILIFPKSLKRFQGSRVVGIKFELLEQPKAVPPRKGPDLPKHRKAPGEKRPARPLQATKPSPPKKLSSHRKVLIFPNQEVPTRVDGKTAGKENGSLAHEVRSAVAEMESGRLAEARRRLLRAVNRD